MGLWLPSATIEPRSEKNIRGICGVDYDMTAVSDILIFGLQLY